MIALFVTFDTEEEMLKIYERDRELNDPSVA